MKKILLFFIITITITHSVLSQTSHDTENSAIIPYHILFFNHKSDTNISIYHEKFYSISDYKRFFDKNLDRYLKLDKQIIYMLNNFSNSDIYMSPDYYFKTTNFSEDRLKGINCSVRNIYYDFGSGYTDSFPATIIIGSINYVLFHLFYDE